MYNYVPIIPLKLENSLKMNNRDIVFDKNTLKIYEILGYSIFHQAYDAMTQDNFRVYLDQSYVKRFLLPITELNKYKASLEFDNQLKDILK